MDTLGNQQIEAAGLTDWRKLAQALYGRFLLTDVGAAGSFVAAVIADAPPPRTPEVRLTGEIVEVVLCTRENGRWITQDDIAAAHRISRLARQHGLRADPANVMQLEIGLDTADADALGRFWSVLLTGSPDNKVYNSIFDPTGRVPAVWFQAAGPSEQGSQRWHFDIWVAPETAEERIAAAVAAGGSIANDAEAPAFTVLADPDGNRVCVCTSRGRD